ncbi:MAG: hypothetical protein ACRCZF_19525, partial [Gemmataceae bacterium]
SSKPLPLPAPTASSTPTANGTSKTVPSSAMPVARNQPPVNSGFDMPRTADTANPNSMANTPLNLPSVPTSGGSLYPTKPNAVTMQPPTTGATVAPKPELPPPTSPSPSSPTLPVSTPPMAVPNLTVPGLETPLTIAPPTLDPSAIIPQMPPSR